MKPAPGRPGATLGPAEVRVWQIELDDARWDAGLSWLSPDEQARASRLRGVLLQRRYRRCRAALRALLADHLSRPADAITFQYSPLGKPRVDQAGPHFNLSHCDDLALIAIASAPLGIDLEAARALDLSGLAPLLCHPQEWAASLALAPAARPAWFYRLWVRKEAYCKALGTGLQRSLVGIHFQVAPDGAFQVCDEQATEAAWYCHDLSLPQAGVAASICLPLARPRIALFDNAAALADGRPRRLGTTYSPTY